MRKECRGLVITTPKKQVQTKILLRLTPHHSEHYEGYHWCRGHCNALHIQSAGIRAGKYHHYLLNFYFPIFFNTFDQG